jgi:hypothetical protein
VNYQTLFDPASEALPQGGGLPNTLRPIKELPDVLDVVAVISNPVRYMSRYNLYRAFERMVANAGARLTTVEIAYANRPFEVTEAGNPRHLQLRSSFELWHKENMINLAVQVLPRDWRHVAWVDADVSFARPDWVQECMQQLQHYPVIQMFSHSLNLAPNFEALGGPRKSFMAAFRDGDPLDGSYQGGLPHPGFAWAARREAINALGGLIDIAILGSADLHMARALVGDVERALPHGISPGYVEQLRLWQDRADRYIQRNVGVMDGLVLHYWHGSRRNRFYNDRWKILVDTQYDPELDLKRDWQGLYMLTDRSQALRDGIRRYFRSRHEDSIDL